MDVGVSQIHEHGLGSIMIVDFIHSVVVHYILQGIILQIFIKLPMDRTTSLIVNYFIIFYKRYAFRLHHYGYLQCENDWYTYKKNDIITTIDFSLQNVGI